MGWFGGAAHRYLCLPFSEAQQPSSYAERCWELENMGFLAFRSLLSVANLSTSWTLNTSYRFPDVKKKKKTKDPLMYRVVFLPAYLIYDCFTELISKSGMSCFNTVHSPAWPWGGVGGTGCL